jgi:methyl-accepting chemotaxis protein
VLTSIILYTAALKSSTVAVVNSRVVVKTTADFLLPILIQTVIIVLTIVSLATIVVTLFVSHKIAGPLYRVKVGMKTLEDGDFSEDFRIRRLDQLQDLATTFDSMIKRIRGELKALKEGFRALQETVDGISRGEPDRLDKTRISELKNLSSKLNKMIGYFKI